jgi:hypothetical protein
VSRKSLVIQTKVDVAGSTHDCKANHGRRVVKGEIRLKVRNGRSWNHYCRECAEKIIALDIEKLTRLRAMTPGAHDTEG